MWKQKSYYNTYLEICFCHVFAITEMEISELTQRHRERSRTGTVHNHLISTNISSLYLKLIVCETFMRN